MWILLTMLNRFQAMDKANAQEVLPQSDSALLVGELVHLGYVKSLKSSSVFLLPKV